MYTELIRLRRSHPILTDPAAQQHVSLVDDVVSIVRSIPGVTATLVLNFSAAAFDHPAPVTADTVVFDSDDERWAGTGWSPAVVNAWSARLSLTRGG